MRITRMRKEGRDLTEAELFEVATALANRLGSSGFLTRIKPLSRTALNIATNDGKLFKVDVERIGWNAIIGYYNGCGVLESVDEPCGFIRTRNPTWAQKYAFNTLINRILDERGITCDVKAAGGLVIRDAETGARHDEIKWFTDVGGNIVVTLLEAVDFSQQTAGARARRQPRRVSARAAADKTAVPYVAPWMARREVS